MTNSVLGVRNIQHTNGTDAMSIRSDGRVIPAVSGSIIQIQYAQSVSHASNAFSNTTYTKLTNFPSVSITPTSTSSKIMIDVMWNGEFTPVEVTWGSVFMLYRDDTLIKGNTETGLASTVPQGMFGSATSYTSTDADSTPERMVGRYFDEPSTTSQITYFLGLFSGNGAGTVHINRTVTGNTSGGYERMISNITATELAG